MKKRVLVLLVVAVLMMAVAAGTASAKPPAGSADTCPGDYQAMTLEDLLAQAEEAGIPEEDAHARFDLINMNQDAWICQAKMPGAARGEYNFIDNQAAGLDKS